MVMATKVAREANKSENLKHTKYDRLAFHHNMEMCPMALKVQGQWGHGTNLMFNYITRRMHKINNASLLPKSFSTSYWKRKICLTLQTQISKHILHAIYNQPFKSIHTTGITRDALFEDLYLSSQVSA